ncbi:MAG: nitrilase-related carbon-nitrogen hydrolase, partial [Planctomycetota bacterium]|nr:nitrilase-related carbon-nitrogen hydrolase [Planctomycetota bacterium]
MTRTAAAQICPEFRNPSANRDKMEDWLRKANGEGAQLVVFPEACVSGYCFEEKEDAARFAEAIPGPRGGPWNASTINGSRQRQNGILNNVLYLGRIVYNRQRFVKDP